MLESLFDKVADLQECIFIKKTDSSKGFFPGILGNLSGNIFYGTPPLATSELSIHSEMISCIWSLSECLLTQ